MKYVNLFLKSTVLLAVLACSQLVAAEEIEVRHNVPTIVVDYYSKNSLRMTYYFLRPKDSRRITNATLAAFLLNTLRTQLKDVYRAYINVLNQSGRVLQSYQIDTNFEPIQVAQRVKKEAVATVTFTSNGPVSVAYIGIFVKDKFLEKLESVKNVESTDICKMVESQLAAVQLVSQQRETDLVCFGKRWTLRLYVR